jgi:hypothetical protein
VEMMQPYTRRLSRQYPGMFVVLLDQSGSMSEPVMGTNATKAQFARTAVNEMIYSMATLAGTDSATGTTKRLAYITVLGYNENVYPLLGPTTAPLPLDFLADNPLGMEKVQLDQLDTLTGTYQSQIVSRPIWITNPVAQGQTHMAKAMTDARVGVEQWLKSPAEPRQAQHTECFPPVIVNITDAEDNGGSDPVQAAEGLRTLGTLQGSCLIFTCHIGNQNNAPIVFPNAEYAVTGVHPMATTMYRMSSVIPDPLLDKAKVVTGGQMVQPGSRAFIYNANTELLVAFLKWGTIGTAGLE